MLRPCPSFAFFICGCHPWMAFTDGRVIHGWHPRTTLPSMDNIHGWKISENWKSTERSLKMSEISKFCNFWAISTCYTSKESIFHIEFNFKQKKYGLFEKLLKISHFCWLGVFDQKFFKFVQRYLKILLKFLILLCKRY